MVTAKVALLAARSQVRIEGDKTRGWIIREDVPMRPLSNQGLFPYYDYTMARAECRRRKALAALRIMGLSVSPEAVEYCSLLPDSYSLQDFFNHARQHITASGTHPQ